MAPMRRRLGMPGLACLASLVPLCASGLFTADGSPSGCVRPHRCERGQRTPAGLADLLGVSRAEGPLAEAAGEDAGTAHGAWRPTSAWYDQQPWDALFPECQHPEWCDALYPPDETARAQAALWAHQNPDDCAASRFLVMDKPFNSGLGSSLHIHMYMLSLALTDDRILVVANGSDWFFGAPGLCAGGGGGDGGEAALAAQILAEGDAAAELGAVPPPSYLDCFFLPTTRCGVPAAWSDAPALASFGQADRVVQTPPVQAFDGTRYRTLTVQSASPGLAEFGDKPTSWWYAQLAKFLVRPTDHVLRDLVWPVQQATFYRTGGRLPRPLAAMFIRAGDKGREAPLQSVAAHFEELAPIAQRLGIRDVYVGSDAYDRIAEALDGYSSNYTIHFVQWQRPDKGLGMADVMHTIRAGWRMDELMRLALADLFITVQADAFVGTLSSNWARLADELRRANGKARVPYATPEKFLQAAGGGPKYEYAAAPAA